MELLLRKNSNAKPNKTKCGLRHFLDMYANDLSIYLEYKRNREFEKRSNVKKRLPCWVTLGKVELRIDP